MLVEQLIFTIIAFVLFVIIFLKMIKNNDTSYVVILILTAIGILINFIEVFSNTKSTIIFKILKYILAIVLPIYVIYIEKKGKKFLEIQNIQKARIYLLFGNDKAAKESLINLISTYPENYTAHKMLAEVYEKEGGMRKAIDEYVQAIDINKQDYNSYYKVANLLTQLDKKDEAAQMLGNLLQKKPDYYKATELLGDILIEKEMYKEAANIYQEALKYNPTSYELNYNLGIAYTMLNDFQSAKEYYEKAAQLNTLMYNSKYSLAEIALIYKELEEAEMCFMQVLEEQDGELEADVYFELARINILRGEKQKAVNYSNLALEIKPKQIAEKIKKDSVFIPILSKLNIPLNLEDMEEEKTKLSKKELKAKKHLEEMVDITRNLSYNDIKLLKKYGPKKEDKNQQVELEKEERE